MKELPDYNDEIYFHLSIGFVGDRQDSQKVSDFIEESEWDEMDEMQKRQWLQEAVKEWAFEYIEYSWSLADGGN